MENKAKIFYIHPCDIRATRREKFEWLQAHKFKDIPFEQITPDKNGNWINLTENDWESLIPLVNKETKATRNEDLENAVFKLFSNGVMTDRDEWVYDHNKANLISKVKYFEQIFNKQVSKYDKSNENLDYSIKWSRDLKNKLQRELLIKYTDLKLTYAIYRPYVKVEYYCDKILNDGITAFHFDFFGENIEKENKIVIFTGLASTSDFSAYATKYIYDRNLYHHVPQFVPLYRYDTTGNRLDNITDWGLEQFRNHYGNNGANVETQNIASHQIKMTETQNIDETQNIASPPTPTPQNIVQTQNIASLPITKPDIFYYVYAVLHNPAYRKKYELNLKREFPRIPFYADFWKWAAWGKELMELHIGYETVEPYELKVNSEKRIVKGKEVEIQPNYVPKAKLKANKETGDIYLDELTTLSGVPKEAWEYKLGIRSALEWILDQYKESTPGDPTIAEKFNTYKFADYKDKVIDLLRRVCTVSVRTVEIMKEMEKV